MNTRDTIAAISTPPGSGGLGIIRLSGPQAREIAAAILRLHPNHEWIPWRITHAHLLDEDGAPVDEVLVSFFAAPRSYTAEDVVEISCHGSPVILRHCVARALRAGARAAEPGEFTLRAYLNGRIDLPRAEAVRDLIHATTLYQARVAAQQLEGSVSPAVAPVKTALVELISLLEAGIDFAEDDVEVASSAEIDSRLAAVLDGLGRLLASYSWGKYVHEGLTLAIVGRPNAGKSSLFNALLGEDRAIVTDIPGTTRDTVSEAFSLEGVPVRLVDTAGIRESTDLVERLGIERTERAMADADITLVVLDLSQPLEEADRVLLGRTENMGWRVVVGNKCDLPRRLAEPLEEIAVSARTGERIEDLKRLLVARIAPEGIAAPQSGLITSARHEALLREAQEAAQKAREANALGLPHELLLLDCYAALRPLDALTGATTADDILNRIFSTFCIGK